MFTTSTSPITVIIVVEVVGVRPNGHTSGAPDVARQMSLSNARGLLGLPVMTMNCKCAYNSFANCTNATISLVLPEFDS